MFDKLLVAKQQLRAKAGFYYRFARQYIKNRYVFSQLIDLSDFPIEYFSVTQAKVIPESEVMDCVDTGDIVIVRDLLAQLNLYPQIQALSRRFFKLDYQQLGDIHQLKSVEQVVDDALAVRFAVPTLIIQTSIMRRLLQPHVDTQFIELLPQLRLHLPFGKIKRHESYIESRLGRGKINPHGQHKDSWRYHPRNTINVWVSLTEANDKNGMGILPHSVDYMPKYNGIEKEMEPGMKTYPSQQYVTDLACGDALIFRAELLHGSIINMSKQTRVAFSMRCTTTQPDFHRQTSLNYIKINGDKFDNLSAGKLKPSGNFVPASRDTCFKPAEQRNTSIEPVEYDDNNIILKVEDKLMSFPRRCPHAGSDMLNGELNDKGELLCPSHRMCLRGKPCESS